MHGGIQAVTTAQLWQLDTKIDLNTVAQRIPVSNCHSGAEIQL
jgi:hypothetical protein